MAILESGLSRDFSQTKSAPVLPPLDAGAARVDRPTEARVRELFEELGTGSHAALQFDGASRELLEQVCRRPELRLLLDGVRILVRDDLAHPFRVPDGSTIELVSSALACPSLAAFRLRHAAEIALCHRLAPSSADPASEIALAIVACHTALAYLDTMTAADQWMVLELSAAWIGRTHQQLRRTQAASQRPDAAAACVARRWRELLPLQGLDVEGGMLDDSVLAHACAQASQALPMATPTEHLLTQGGDSRLIVDPATRLNKYGCSSSPRPWAITFSNCTASSPSDLGYEMAEHSRQTLLAGVLRSQRFSDVFRAEMERVRARARSVLRLEDSSAELIFSASGTDCELYALFIALATHPGDVVNLVMAPTEIGSGSVPAASGRHFDSIVPAGHRVQVGGLVDGIASRRVRVETVALRHEDGTVIPLAAVDAHVSEVVSLAAARGELVLMHLLDSSKTGLRGPSLQCARALQQRHGSSVMVVVDAAQMRTSRESLAAYLASDFMVILSGSKFYTGSPFSGGLLVPERLARVLDQVDALPEGLGDYLSAYEIPPRWSHLRSQLPMAANVGVVVRWLVATWEMQAFSSVPATDQREYLHRFAEQFRAALAARPNLILVPAPIGERRDDAAEGGWDTVQTIFTFIARTPSGSTLSYDEAWRVYNWLNADLADRLPDSISPDERTVACKPCHIGQPVLLGRAGGSGIGALRLAAGARLVSRVAFDPTLGSTPDERLQAQVADAVQVLDKIDLILRHWSVLNQPA